MLVEAFSAIIYGAVFLSLILIDYLLGHGFVDIFQTMICKFTCFVRNTVREEAMHMAANPENPISIPVLFMEILVMSVTIAFLNKYKQLRCKDRFDDLLRESKEALRQTNEFLEKWRLRRVPNEYSYLDEEPQEVTPLKVEVPILHMAIIDTLGGSRCQYERGDAGDAVNISDSALLSVTSLLGDDFDEMSEIPSSDEKIDVFDETRNVEFKNRTLWDVMEEDSTNLED